MKYYKKKYYGGANPSSEQGTWKGFTEAVTLESRKPFESQGWKLNVFITGATAQARQKMQPARAEEKVLGKLDSVYVGRNKKSKQEKTKLKR